ncbi:MAG: hypothetical protein GWN56_15300 [Nitrosopumilaceae archaeon]|nr:hypothetical protein [Nitrosopumilaceae archaeon]
MYINYGSSAIGKIKGVCRKVGTDGKWFGQASHTDYSPQNISGSYSQNKIISCPKDWAVSGFKGKVYEYSTRHQIKAIKLKCRKLTSGGKLTGSSQDLSWVGPGGGIESSSISCSSDKPARKVIGHSKTYLQGFSLDCSQVPVQQVCTEVEVKRCV